MKRVNVITRHFSIFHNINIENTCKYGMMSICVFQGPWDKLSEVSYGLIRWSIDLYNIHSV